MLKQYNNIVGSTTLFKAIFVNSEQVVHFYACMLFPTTYSDFILYVTLDHVIIYYLLIIYLFIYLCICIFIRPLFYHYLLKNDKAIKILGWESIETFKKVLHLESNSL